jgi:phosphotransferase system enzyme I (PtsI)
VTLSANIEFGSELESVKNLGAEGIGLYRTEFFFFESGTLPDEEKQTENYSRFAQAMQQGGVIIRTLDVGGDKVHPELEEREPNPFLGCRGIRFSLTEPSLLKTQIRAILRASAFGKLRLMFPMISGMEELRAALAMLEVCRNELRKEHTPFDEALEVGCMIEVPSAAMQADDIAREVDFLSVGTNDLVQYTIAVDRANEKVAHLYQPAHPAVLRLLKNTVDAAHAHGIWAGICGEMAGERLFTPLLLGLGFDEFSVSPTQLLEVKEAMSLLDSRQCRDFAEELLRCHTPADVMKACNEWAEIHFANSVLKLS